MIRRRNRSAWIWVAFAALTLASVARAEAGMESAKAYANPVLQFFANTHSSQPAAMHGVAGTARHYSARQIRAASRHAVAGTWMAMLPVLFVGLVSPLNQLSRGSALTLGGAPTTPLLPAAFQRPPPFQLA